MVEVKTNSNIGPNVNPNNGPNVNPTLSTTIQVVGEEIIASWATNEFATIAVVIIPIISYDFLKVINFTFIIKHLMIKLAMVHWKVSLI